MRNHILHGTPTIALRILQAVLFGTPLLLGGVHPEVLASAMVPLGMALLLLAFAMHKTQIRFSWPPFFWLLATAGFLTAAYLLPVPQSWVEWLSPQSLAIWKQARLLTGSDETSVRLGHHFSQNTVELGRGLAMLGVFVLTYTLARSDRRHGATVLHGIAWTAFALVIIGTIQTALDTGPLFGLYTPTSAYATRGFYATFVNENHLAGFLNLGALIALGQSFEAPSPQRRVLFALCYIATTTAVVLSLSRGGLVAAVAGVAAFFLLSIKFRPAGRRKRSFQTPFFVVVLVTITLVAAFGYEHVVAQWGLSNAGDTVRDELKLRMIPDTLRMLSDYWRTGTGPGSFGHVFASYNTVSVHYTFTHPENLVLQLAADYGWIAAATFLVLGAAFLVRPLARGCDSPAGTGAICGLFGLVLHNLVDFSLLIPGIALAAVAVVAVLLAEFDSARPSPQPTRISHQTSQREGQDVREWWARGRKSRACNLAGWRARFWEHDQQAWADRRSQPKVGEPKVGEKSGLSRVGAIALAVIIVSGAPLMIWAESRYGDEAVDRALTQKIESAIPGTATTPLSAALQQLFWARPADPHLYYLESAFSFRSGDLIGAQTWIDAARSRAPRQATVRLLAAKIAFATQNRGAAVTILRDLLVDDWSLFPNIFKDYLPLFPQPKDSFAILPQTDSLVASASLQAYVAGKRRLALQWLNLATDEHADWYECHLQYGLWLAESPGGESLASRQATRLLGFFPDKAGGYLVQAALDERAGRLERALVLYRESQKWDAQSVDALLGEARVQVELGDMRQTRLVLGRARSYIGDKKEQLGTLYEILSRASEREGRYDAAATEMAIAVQMRPNKAAFWRRLSILRSKAGESTGARAALRQAQYLESQNE